MTLTIRTLGIGLCLSLALACGDDDDDHGADHEGLQKCCYIGEVCHMDGDAVPQNIRDCHELGHSNDPDECTAMFDSCLSLCDPEGETTLPEMCEDPSGDPH